MTLAPAPPWCFATAASVGETLLLRVPGATGAVRDALGAAVALADCEPLLLLLEAWLGVALDPAPVAELTAPSSHGHVEAELTDVTLGPAGTRIALPWPLLARRPPPPEALRRLRWPLLRFEVELAAFTALPLPADAKRVAAGGALLLPPSFEPGWPLHLFERRLGLHWSAGWTGPPFDPMPAGPPLPGTPDAARWRVVLDQPLGIELGHALCWAAPPAAERPCAPASLPFPPDATFDASLLPPGGGPALARGTVQPMLRGAGLALAAAPDAPPATTPPARSGCGDPLDLTQFSPASALVTVVALALAPFVAVMVTSFTKIIVVLSLLRNALGLQQVPPNVVLNGIAIVLTVYVMFPVGEQMSEKIGSLDKLGQNTSSLLAAVDQAKEPLRDFLVKHAHPRERAFFFRTAQKSLPPERAAQVTERDFIVVLPAFTVSELSTAFQIGFLIFLPFLVIDLVISNILMSMGMQMLTPTTVSLPFKLLLFVLVDGWVKLSHGLVLSYH